MQNVFGNQQGCAYSLTAKNEMLTMPSNLMRVYSSVRKLVQA